MDRVSVMPDGRFELRGAELSGERPPEGTVSVHSLLHPPPAAAKGAGDEAMRHLRKALPLSNLASARIGIGRCDHAESAARRAVAADPSSHAAREVLRTVSRFRATSR